MKWLLWAGRGCAAVLFLFWGAFFVEHVQEWFLDSGGKYPPPFVWVAMVFHLAMLIGLAIIMKWDRTGAAILLAATAAFFATIAQLRWQPVLLLALINLAPVLFLAAHWALSRKIEPGHSR